MQRIYDSKQQSLVDFVPLTEGEVSMYICGPTVQSSPHIGHLRSALAYDQMRRWFTVTGQRVTFVRNVTDIDDKILDGAQALTEAGNTEEWWALAYRIEREFTAAYDAIGVLAPTYEPRATANIIQMIELIEQLIARGHAYQASDGSASVYFDASSWPNYGELTRQSLDQMEDTADSATVGKKNPHDFALWKAHRDTEPLSASWNSQWGRGRPGWHIECSAMAARYLGEEFDIHGGGLDLRFPHHENELAQSTAAGHSFARHWVHNGMVNTAGQKMSKSLGNSLFAADLLATTRPIVLRYFLGSAHYRSVLEYSPDSLIEAAAAFERIETFLERAVTVSQPTNVSPADSSTSFNLDPLNGRATVQQLPKGFVDAMLDDFSLPQALAVLHDAVRSGNTAIDTSDIQSAQHRALEVVAMLDVLGIDPRADAWAESSGTSQGDAQTEALEHLVSALIDDRRAARESKDFTASDAIRDRLQQAGITLEDSPNGTRWSLR